MRQPPNEHKPILKQSKNIRNSMEIQIRNLSDKYKYVTVVINNTTIDLGVLNKQESQEMVDKFQEAIERLSKD